MKTLVQLIAWASFIGTVLVVPVLALMHGNNKYAKDNNGNCAKIWGQIIFNIKEILICFGMFIFAIFILSIAAKNSDIPFIVYCGVHSIITYFILKSRAYSFAEFISNKQYER